MVSGAERGSLDISDLDPRRLRNLCANGLTYRRHIKKTVEKDQDGKEFEVVEEWEEPSLPSIQLCGTVLADPAIRLYRPVLSGDQQGARAAARAGRHAAGAAGGRPVHLADLLAGPADRAHPGQSHPQ